ncbi:SET domain-containing 5 [Pyrenophora seminiperda CCB06]|uniref:SET domain-containing 5 n=1 Tax=Pyrenophora seminiperda CCB06 TaxID=1302712 RepID=A0A3M7ME11_9PLEO|nr:SET domain-containing 5 [Pyrenophora seminiperda CCB06]
MVFPLPIYEQFRSICTKNGTGDGNILTATPYEALYVHLLNQGPPQHHIISPNNYRYTPLSRQAHPRRSWGVTCHFTRPTVRSRPRGSHLHEPAVVTLSLFQRRYRSEGTSSITSTTTRHVIWEFAAIIMSSIRILITLLSACAIASHLEASQQCENAPRHFVTQAQAPLPQQQCLGTDAANIDPADNVPKFQHPVWSHKPVCQQGYGKSYCTHTTVNGRNGRGISIIAMPVAAEKISAAFQALGSNFLNRGSGLEVRPIRGKGKGLVTLKPIKKGDTILLESARVIASSHFPTTVTRVQGQTLFNSVLDQLPAADRNDILELDQSLGGSQMEDIMKTNAFACQLADGNVDDAYMCLFPSVARINHACKPNAHARFVPKLLSMEIKAQRDINAGEEIDISYGRIDLKHTERQRLYRQGWNFTCTCSLCTASLYEMMGSDQRRERFAKLRHMLESLTPETYDAAQIIAWEKEIMEIGQAEGLEILLAQDYERLAYVYAGHGMMRDAKAWATKAKASLLQWVIVDGGPDIELRRVEELLKELEA